MASSAQALAWLRRGIVFATIAFCLAVSGFDIAAHVEQWPFSHYPMYAGLASREFSMLRLYGVGAGGEFSIPEEALRPFGYTSLSTSLDRIVKSGDSRRLRNALRDCLRIYRETRRNSLIGAVRLYRVAWTSDSVSRTLVASSEEARQ